MKNSLRLIFIILTFLLMIAPVSSQNTATHVLEPATVDEFIEAIPDMVEGIQEHNSAAFKGLSNALTYTVREIDNDFWLRYGDTATIPQLQDAFDKLSTYYSHIGYADFPIIWYQTILERGLLENPTDLDSTQELIVEDYTFNVSESFSISLENEGWILAYRGHYFLAETDPASPSGYRISSFPTNLAEAGATYEIRDVTGDGIVEFIFNTRTNMFTYPNRVHTYYYDVIGWVDGELQSIMRSRNSNNNISWTLDNVDRDAALEIIETTTYTDNFSCERDAYILFDYQDGEYEAGEEISTFAETGYCDLRQGQQAMLDNDFEGAITHFENAVMHFNTLQGSVGYISVQPYADYATERLIIAHALTGQLDEAETLIVEMNQQEQPEDTIAYALNLALEDGISAIEICQTAYDAVLSVHEINFSENYRGIPQIGWISEAYYRDGRSGTSQIQKASCNLADLANELILAQSFPANRNPVEQIEQLGFTNASSNLVLDFNQDGFEDYMVWINNVDRGYFFLSEQVYFQVSGTNISLSNERNPVRLIEFPQSDGYGIATFYAYIPEDCAVGSGLNANDSGTYSMSLWVLDEDSRLRNSFTGRICSTEDLPETISLTTTLPVWSVSFVDIEQRMSVSDYTWDADEQTYIAPEDEEIPIWRLYSVMYLDHDYELAISQINEWLEISEDEDRTQLLYYRGLAYQMLGQEDEALADYVLVYSDSPYTIWGYLAELQLSDTE